jgi:hypothetical protein
MSIMMRAIQIDATKQQVTEIDLGGPFDECLLAMREVFGNDDDTLTLVLPNGDKLLVIKDVRGKTKESWFLSHTPPYEFFGNGLIIGVNERRRIAPAKTDLTYLTARIAFMPRHIKAGHA